MSSENGKTVFITKATRSNDVNGLRFDLIPSGPLRRLAMVYSEGAEEHGEGNYLKGLPDHDTYNHVIEHLELYKEGKAGKKVKKEDHLGKAAWGLFTLMYFQDNPNPYYETTKDVGAKQEE